MYKSIWREIYELKKKEKLKQNKKRIDSEKIKELGRDINDCRKNYI